MRFYAILFCIATLTSCSRNINTSAEVKKIDSLLTQVKAAEQVYNSEIPHAEITWRLDSLSRIFKTVEASQENELSKENAMLLSRYNDTKGIVKKYKQRSPRIKSEISRTQSQLSNFKQALESGATHDKNGNVIDKAYISAQMKKETEAAEYLVKSIMELKERGTRFIDENEKRLQDVLPYVKGL